MEAPTRGEVAWRAMRRVIADYCRVELPAVEPDQPFDWPDGVPLLFRWAALSVECQYLGWERPMPLEGMPWSFVELAPWIADVSHALLTGRPLPDPRDYDIDPKDETR